MLVVVVAVVVLCSMIIVVTVVSDSSAIAEITAWSAAVIDSNLGRTASRIAWSAF